MQKKQSFNLLTTVFFPHYNIAYLTTMPADGGCGRGTINTDVEEDSSRFVKRHSEPVRVEDRCE